jgi:hypothetical protein
MKIKAMSYRSKLYSITHKLSVSNLRLSAGTMGYAHPQIAMGYGVLRIYGF